MKYYKFKGEVYAFELDGSQDAFIKNGYVLMTAVEVDKHRFPEKYMSDVEREELRLLRTPSLTIRQFRLALLKYDIKDKLEKLIDGINDSKLKSQIEIEYEYSTVFERSNESVKIMLELLDLSNDEIDEIWGFGLSIK